jgi:polyisoprenoid-binding protein YceI
MKTLIKKSITSVFLVLLSISFYGQSATKYTVDVANSVIHWKGFKPMGSQSGTIKIKNGFIEVENLKLSKGFFIANMNTIKDEKGSAKLVKHLKSVDFFDVETFPTAIFTIKSVKNIKEKTFLVGDLTIKNITKQMTVPVDIFIDESAIHITTATFKVNRADFNITYKSKSFFANLKDKFIRDDFDLQVVIVAKLN